MDRRDEQSGQMAEIHQSLLTAYTQYTSKSESSKSENKNKDTISRTDAELDETEKGDISHA